MKKFFIGIGFSLTLILCAHSHAQKAYVSDMLLLTFREGPGTNFAVIKTIRSNTPLTVLEEDQGYYKVALDTGEQGWVDKQFVVFDPPNALMIDQLTREKEALEGQLASLAQTSGQFKEELTAQQSATGQTISDLETRIQQMTQENLSLAAQLKESQEALSNLKEASKDVVAALETQKTLTAENQQLTQAMAKMEKESSLLFRTGMIKWFLSGVGVLLLGWLFGLMLSSKRRRRSSLLD